MEYQVLGLDKYQWIAHFLVLVAGFKLAMIVSPRALTVALPVDSYLSSIRYTFVTHREIDKTQCSGAAAGRGARAGRGVHVRPVRRSIPEKLVIIIY